MKKKIVTVIGLILVALMAACSTNNENNVASDNEVDNIKELVNDYSVGNIEAKSASITSNELIVINTDESKVIYDLPEDDFFVSIAPYYDNTHS